MIGAWLLYEKALYKSIFLMIYAILGSQSMFNQIHTCIPFRL